MSTFDFQLFIANPTWEVFEQSRKDELLQIADHYRIPVVRQLWLKHVIKNEILKHLAELNASLFPDGDKEGAGASAVEWRDKWLSASNVHNLNSLKELLLLEEFKSCLSERRVTYLNKQKVISLSQATILADEYVLMHKSVFVLARPEKKKTLISPSVQNFNVCTKTNSGQNKETRECFYCQKAGHLISDCFMLKCKHQQGQVKPANFVRTVSETVLDKDEIDAGFKPFLMKGLISINGSQS